MQTHDKQKQDINFKTLGKRLGWAEHEIAHARDSFQQHNDSCQLPRAEPRGLQHVAKLR